VSVIVPARNEEDCLGACLQSLVAQTGVPLEIFVVDDYSTDRTRAIATSFPGVKVLDSGPLPPGWSGKNNAVTAGVHAARGEWLLFTDADTVHLPGSLARALAEARDRHVALLSYSPEQEVRSLWEKAIMPVIFAELASAYRPADVSDPNSPAAAANGQYILVERSAYDGVGGHSAVATSLLEDVALARAFKQSGRPIFFRLGTGLVRARMYRTFAQLREGWTKNLALLFADPARLAIRRAAEFLLLVGSTAITILAFTTSAPRSAKLAAVALAVVFWTFFLKRILRAHFSWQSTALAVFGLPLFSWLLMRSKSKYASGEVSWKGRVYAAHTFPATSKEEAAQVAGQSLPVP
jgi:glycosyltransferase involved in cell wall biosynthesis